MSRIAEAATLNRRAALFSVSVAVLLLGLKGWALERTGSAAMLGSLADTALDLVASLATLTGVSIAARPADSDHRFGHDKAEALAAMFQVLLIALSASAIAFRAVLQLLDRGRVAEAQDGIVVSLIAMGATVALLVYQRRVIRRTSSVAIRADHVHYQSDLLVNLGVIVALALDQYAGITGADAIMALAIAAWLAWGAWRASISAVEQLMDREWPLEKREAFIEVVGRQPELHGVHDLRTRTSGNRDFVQFHVWVDGDMTVAESHRIIEEIETRLEEHFPGVEVLIHADPEGHADGFGATEANLLETGLGQVDAIFDAEAREKSRP